MSDGAAGALYERKLNQALKNAKVQRASFIHNPFDQDHPDAVFSVGGKEYGIEVKHVFRTSYGSIGITHNGKKWVLSTPKEDNTFLYKILKDAGVENKINAFYKYTGVPFLFTESKLTPAQRKQDVDRFGGKTLSIDIPASTASKYYSSKGVDYIQIQDYGFYYLKDNPAGIDCPKFNINRMFGEVRLKKENKQGLHYYRFVMQIKSAGLAPEKSNRNLDISTDFLKKQ